VSDDPQFVLRFVPHIKSNSPSFPKDASMMASKGFNLYPQRASTSTSSTSTSSPSSSKTSAASDSNGTTKKKNKNKKKSKTGAIAGGVLGGLVVLALLLGGMLVVLRRLRKKKEATDSSNSGPTGKKGGVQTYAYEIITPPAEPLMAQNRTPEIQDTLPSKGHYAPSTNHT
jgi:hypothetical protein